MPSSRDRGAPMLHWAPMDAANDRLNPPAGEAALHRLLFALLAVLLLAGAAPLFAAAVVYRFFHSLRVFGLVSLGLAAALAPALVAWRAARAAGEARALRADRLVALALWSACAVGAAAALLALTFTAQTMVPTLVAEAQRNTLPYVVLQPVAAAVFVLAVALAASPAGFAAFGLAPAAARMCAALVMLAGGAALAIWFLGFDPGFGPAPLWLAVKVLLGAAVIGAVARRAAARGPRVRLAWVALVVGLLNVIGTLLVLARLGGGGQ